MKIYSLVLLVTVSTSLIACEADNNLRISHLIQKSQIFTDLISQGQSSECKLVKSILSDLSEAIKLNLAANSGLQHGSDLQSKICLLFGDLFSKVENYTDAGRHYASVSLNSPLSKADRERVLKNRLFLAEKGIRVPRGDLGDLYEIASNKQNSEQMRQPAHQLLHLEMAWRNKLRTTFQDK